MKESTGANMKQKSNGTVRCMQSMGIEKPVERVEALERSARRVGPRLVFRRGARAGWHSVETPRVALSYRDAQFNLKLFSDLSVGMTVT